MDVLIGNDSTSRCLIIDFNLKVSLLLDFYLVFLFDLYVVMSSFQDDSGDPFLSFFIFGLLCSFLCINIYFHSLPTSQSSWMERVILI